MGPEGRLRLYAASAGCTVLAALTLAAVVAGWRLAAVVLGSLTLVSIALYFMLSAGLLRGGAVGAVALDSFWAWLYDSLPFAALLVDEGGLIINLNSSCMEMLRLHGIHERPEAGSPLNQAFLPPFFGNWTPVLDEISGPKDCVEYSHAEYITPERSGACRVWLSRFGMTPSEGTVYLLLIQDISEESASSAALLESRDREIGMFEGVPVKIAVLDRNFRLVRCNRLMQEWLREAFGIHDLAPPGPAALDILPQEFRADWKRILRRVMVEGRAFEQPRVQQVVGDTVYFHRVRLHPMADESGSMREALLLYEDVTEYVRLERRLAETTDYFNLLIESLNDGFYAMDADGRFSFCNQAFLDMLGMNDSKELYDRRSEYIVASEERERMREMLERRSRGERVFFETFFKRKDGSVVPVRISSAPLFRAGKFVGIVGIATDLSERRQLEAMVERSQEDLEKAYEELSVLDKMKSDFIAIASHELRTPLSIIKGYADAFQYGELGELTSFQQDKIKLVNARADQMAKIINDLLDVTRLDEGRLVGERWPAPVEELVVSAVSEYKNQASMNEQDLFYTLEDDLPPVSVDVWRVHQVMENLVGNALKFTPQGGEIEVSARNSSEEGMIEIEIRDTGPGIPAREQPKLFTMFYQAETNSTRSAGGLGLGLVISKGIVEGHGGRIWVESEPGTGASFKFTLPAHKGG